MINSLSRISILALVAVAISSGTARAQYTETVLYNFGASTSDAQVPNGILTMDTTGNIFGASNNSVFELSPNAGSYTATVLHLFLGGSDGQYPNGRLVFDASGNIFGSTNRGGSLNDGIIFELSPNGSGGYNETILYNFIGSTDGEFPTGGLLADSAGNLYGTAARGGASGNGTIFKIFNTVNYGWQEKTMYSFTGGSDGSIPAALIADSAGNFYGLGFTGGSTSCGCGTVFRLSPSQGWRFTTIHQFNMTDGAYPEGTLTLDSAGNLYGGTLEGGVDGWGVIYELSPMGNTWRMSTLHSFTASYDGADAAGYLTLDASGNIYGTTTTGTQTAYGTAFELSPLTGGGWGFKRLHDFTGQADGGNPRSTVFVDASGNVFGTTSLGGTNSFGVFFELSPPAGN